MLAVDDEH